MKSVITIKDLSFYFNNNQDKIEVLKNINLTINEGDFVAFQGRSGSGKSTLLNLLAGFMRPKAGSIVINSMNLSELSENKLSLFRRDNIGFIFQSYHLFPNMTALDNIQEPLFYAGVKKKERTKRAYEMLEKVGLSDRAKHLTQQLSGGQQQRVSIARALVTNPNIILADEPTGNLDSLTEEGIMDLLVSINKDLGKTIVIVTHDDNVARLANRIIELDDGSLVTV